MIFFEVSLVTSFPRVWAM